jgi:hypothetical protein
MFKERKKGANNESGIKVKKNERNWVGSGVVVSGVPTQSTLTRLTSPDTSCPSACSCSLNSGLLRFPAAPAVAVVLLPAAAAVVVVACSSLRKLGPDGPTGVAKLSGLGMVLLSEARKFQSA